jgi:hypothetical protein
MKTMNISMEMNLINFIILEYDNIKRLSELLNSLGKEKFHQIINQAKNIGFTRFYIAYIFQGQTDISTLPF